MSRWRGLVNFITCDPGWQSQWIIAWEASANSSLTNTLQIFYNYTNTQEMLSQTWSEWYLKVERPQMQTQMQGENSINVKQYGRIKCILGGIYGKYKVEPKQIQGLKYSGCGAALPIELVMVVSCFGGLAITLPPPSHLQPCSQKSQATGGSQIRMQILTEIQVQIQKQIPQTLFWEVWWI